MPQTLAKGYSKHQSVDFYRLYLKWRVDMKYAQRGLVVVGIVLKNFKDGECTEVLHIGTVTRLVKEASPFWVKH